jgi:hypothetical protein
LKNPPGADADQFAATVRLAFRSAPRTCPGRYALEKAGCIPRAPRTVTAGSYARLWRGLESGVEIPDHDADEAEHHQ